MSMGFLLAPTNIILSFLSCLLLSMLPIVWNIVVYKRRLKHTAYVVPATLTPDYIPNDLLMEIVSRLPVKSIFRLRSVSKSCRSFLSDKSLESYGVLPSCMTHILYSGRRAKEVRSFAHYMSVQNTNHESNCRFGCRGCSYKGLTLVNICNGLALSCINYVGKRGEYIVWNPINNSYIALLPAPHASEEDYGRYRYLASLEYDPRTSDHHFKVVSFLPWKADRLKFVLAIFSSEVGEWVFSNIITTISPLPNFRKSVSRNPAFLNGALYVMLPSTSHLIQLDFSRETFHVIKLPGGELDSSSCLGVSRGCLYYALICNDEKLRIWKLQDFSTEQWALRNTAPVKELVKKLPVGETPGQSYKDLLAKSCFHADEESIYFAVGKSIFSYVMKRGVVNFLHKSDRIPNSRNGLIPFSPCLVNLFERYNLDDGWKKQQVKKQWCFKELRQS